MTYRVKLDLFEGPLDLLLHLVKKNEMDIANIPIAIITDQYLEYMVLLEELNLDVAGEFLVMAATLMYINSRHLLPEPEGAEDEDEAGDPRAELIERLQEYQRFRDAALQLEQRDLLSREVFARPRDLDVPEEDADEEAPVEFRDVSLGGLLEAFRKVLRRAVAPPAHEVVSEGLAIQDCMAPILECLRPSGRTTFEALFPEDSTRHRIIVTFLALLELMRLGVVSVHQPTHFGELVIALAASSVEVAAELVRAGEFDDAPRMGEA